jgi:CelD/BcsL family acetyltransferase involved in cellulose biosynthesis
VIAVSYHADLKEVQCDRDLARLLGIETRSSPFDRLAWWQGLAEHCGIEPLLAVASDGTGRAVLPLSDNGQHLEALANWYSFHVRPVVSPGADRTAMLGAIARDLARRTHRLTLAGVPGEDGSADAIRAAFSSAGWWVLREASDANHILHVEGRSFAEYFAQRPGALRSTVRRKAGKLVCEVLDRFDPQVWAEYEAIYARSWKPVEGSPRFLRAFAEAEGMAGRLRLGVARADGQAVAAQLWTVEARTAFIHKLAHLEEARALSPGSVLSAAMFAHAIDRDRVAMIDFGTGNDAYKRDWMEDVRPRYRLDMLRPGHPRSWPVLLRAAGRAMAARLAPRAKHG